MKLYKSLSLVTLIVISGIISIYRITHVSDRETSWDVLGYYLYLPATFIYHQPMLNDITWLEKINAEKDLTGTLYQVSTNDEGQPMYFFLMGMSILYLPFFLIGHALAGPLGYPADGFSLPYQYALVIGAIFYTIVGLIYLRKNLLRFFSEKMTVLVMIIIVFGTNYIHHLTLKDLETVNMLFMLVNIVLWNTIRWHETYKFRNMLGIGLGITLTTLIKPSEVFIFLIPLLWNVTSFKTFKEKLLLFYKNRVSLLTALGISILLALPQLSYWYLKTGHIFYDSYKNPGVGLDLLSPHIIDVLFSYRKGWLLYTPVMIFALAGFYFLYRENRKIFFANIIYFLVSFYIMSSWTEWWYGAAFSGRPMITLYPILAISLGYFMLYIKNRKWFVKALFGTVVVLFIALNQFQWWQFKRNILDPYRTTKDYYWAVFLKTSASDQDRNKLLVYRDFSGKMEMNNPDRFQKWILVDDHFDDTGRKGVMADSTGTFMRLEKGKEFYPIFETSYRELTAHDYAWLKASMDVRYPENYQQPLPCFVMTMERKEGSYRYFAPVIPMDSTSIDRWKHISEEYLTPEIRDSRDRFKCYIWNRSKDSFDIDNVRLELYKEK